MHFILAVLALLLIAKALLQITREKIPTPDAFASAVWGVVLLLGAIEFLRYSDLTLKGVLVLMSFVILITVLFLLLPKVTPRRPPSLPPVTHEMLQLTRFISVLVIIGVGLRLYHNVVIYQRPLFDVQMSYEITATEIMPGTWFSRFAVILFLWPVPASILAWYAIQLRWWDRALFFIGSLGHAFFGLMQGGRSGLLLTLAFIIPIVWLSLVVGPASYASKRQKSLFLTGVAGFAGASFLLLLIMFGLRTSDAISGGKFSRVMDVNPRYELLVDPFESSVLQEGVLGAIGYGTQPS
ncbi:MAG: hypothetical protein NDI75_13895, partial [Candidatus Didemnitutus sp.]|nr:hypothetical protein [Candidatus Didemnitutus sp.]